MRFEKVFKTCKHLRIFIRSFEMSEHNSNSNQSANNREERPKLKILAFHGYRQNATVFKSKIGSFRKAVSKYAQLTFISAPHKVYCEDGGGEEGNCIFILFVILLSSS